MAEQPSKGSTWATRVVVYGGAVAGLGLVVGSVVADDAPGWWLWVGLPLLVVFGTLAAIWIGMRLRYTPEERQQRFAALADRQAEVGEPLERSRLAHRATKEKDEILACGVDGAAVVTFVADGKRANEFRKLVYLELEVVQDDRDPYIVRTGEWSDGASSGSLTVGSTLAVKVDPADPERVAVDWERQRLL